MSLTWRYVTEWRRGKARRRERTFWCVMHYGPVLYAALHWESGWPISFGHLDARDHAGESTESLIQRVKLMALERRVAIEEASGQSDMNPEPRAVKEVPNVWEYLTSCRYADGSPRETSSISIFCQDGQIRIMLRDRDSQQCLWATGDGLFVALKLLNDKLGDPRAEWRQDRFAKGNDGKEKGSASRQKKR